MKPPGVSVVSFVDHEKMTLSRIFSILEACFFFASDQFTGKFNWKGNIKAVLRDSPDQELSLKKIRKKVRHGVL